MDNRFVSHESGNRFKPAIRQPKKKKKEERKTEKRTVLVTAMLMLSVLLPRFLMNETASLAASIAAIRFDPAEIKNISVSQSFEISVKVMNVTNLSSFTLGLSFNNTLLSVLEVRNGTQDPSNVDHFDPYNQTGKPTNFTQTDWNATGAIWVKGGYKEAVNDQTLAIITFNCNNNGTTIMTLNTTNTNLYNPVGQSINYIKEPIPTCKCIQSSTIKGPLYVNRNLTLTCNMFLSGDILFCINASNVVLDLNGFTISAAGKDQHGIAIQASPTYGSINNICIKNGTIDSFQVGISAQNCNGLEISNVTVLESLKIGVEIHRSSNITIVDSTIYGTWQGEGIWLKDCCEESGSWANISDNEISSNRFTGISLQNSYNCTVSRNKIDYNSKGLLLNSVKNVTVFNNNFINNTDDDGVTRNAEGVGSKSVWNVNYPYGGNYWEDYADKNIGDSVCGKNGDIPECDGIGDTPYRIPGDTQDDYPLLCPFNASLPSPGNLRSRIFETPLKASQGTRTKTTSLIVAVFGDFTDVGNLTFSKTTEGGLITFDIDGGSFCNVIVQSELLAGRFRVSVDNITTPSKLYWDDTYTFAYFNHVARSRQVKIVVDMTGDINGDGKVNMLDITKIAKMFGYELQNP